MKRKKLVIALVSIAVVVCIALGVTLYFVLFAHKHNLTEHPMQPSTCTAEGNVAYWYCDTCNKYFSDRETKIEITLSDTVIAKLPHTEVTDQAIAPTCTQTGLTEGKHCSVCKTVLVEQQSVKATGHTEVVDKAVAPTCTETGLTEGKHCSVCDTVLVEQQSVKATGHTEVTDQAIAPTCTETGLTEGKHCSVCDTVLIEPEVIKKLDHDIQSHGAQEATCTEVGWNAYETCSRCDYTTYNEIPATGHTEVIDKAIAPTCTETGLTEGKHCSVCKTVLVEQQSVKATGHTEVTDQAVAPTCTQTGLTEGKHCSVCKTVLVEQQSVKATGHTEVIDKAVAPTCTQAGLTEGKHCSVCNTVLVAQNTIGANGHSWVYDKLQLTHSATCKNCDEVITSTDHTWNDNDCTVCGYDAGGSKGLSWKLLDNGTYEVAKLGNCTATSIIIPSTYNGKPVTSIDESAFRFKHNITSVIIPDSVTTIGTYAFDGCFALTSVTLGKGIKQIGSYVFDFVETSNIYYTGDIVSWCGIEGVSSLFFDTCTIYIDGKVISGELIIPDGITKLNDYVFYNFDGITSVVIPDSVTSIGYKTFAECDNLSTVTIGKNVASMNFSVFSNCANLKTVYWNATSCSLRGTSYSPFSNCNNISKIVIGENVKSLPDGAFNKNYGITDISYSGTVEEWNAIIKGKNWISSMSDYIVTCSNGKVDKYGNPMTTE